VRRVKGKIILVDDEKYEKDFLQRALENRNWKINIEYFSNVDEALEHLKKNADEIFLIISDMAMPRVNGMEFKKLIDQDPYLKQKAIPFIFACNSISRKDVIEAYKYNVQGYFQKPMLPAQQADMLEIIIQYWINSVHPDKSDLPLNPYL
jgi:DNA-binding NtrC family response regulator